MQKKDAKRLKKGDKKVEENTKEDRHIIYLKKVRKEKREAKIIYLFCINKFGPRMPETLRDALNSIPMAMDVHIYSCTILPTL